MANNSKIQWCEATWNPIAGCDPISPGCLRCYAAKMAFRLGNMGQRKYQGLTVLRNGIRTFNGTIHTEPDDLDIPFCRRKPTTYFVNSMSDLFHEKVPIEFIARVFAVMGLASWHKFQVLTKRAERMADVLGSKGFELCLEEASQGLSDYADDVAQGFGLFNVHERRTGDWRNQVHDELPLPNVMLGVSCEDQKRADERIPHLLRTNAAIRFLSCEPLLGPINLERIMSSMAPGGSVNCLCREDEWGDYPAIGWVIAGGESGGGARPCNVEWIRSIVRQCKPAGVPCFVKQMGASMRMSFDEWNNKWMEHSDVHRFTLNAPGASAGIWRGNDKKGGEPEEWAEDLRVRQMPADVPPQLVSREQRKNV